MSNEPVENDAFTLVEVLVVVGVIGILGSIAYVSITGLRETSADTKLRSDVLVINRALDAYRASGGAIADDAQASEVLVRLKSRAAPSEGLLAFTNAFIDPRTKAIWQSDGEAATSMLRARFVNERLNTNIAQSQDNPRVPRFYVANQGTLGIKEFVFDETEATNIAADTNRTAMLARGSGGWIWDYNVTSPTLADAAPSILPGTTNSALVSTGASIFQLQKPVFAPPGASYNLGSFTNADGTIVVRITSPNPPGAWAIYYATAKATALNTNVAPPSFSLLTAANGEIQVPAETQVWAYVASLDPTRFRSSEQTTGFYGVLPVTLAMSISASASVSYPQAISTNPPQAEIRLVPNFDFKYATNGDITPYYSTSGTDPYPGGIVFSNWSNPTYVNLVPDLWTGTNTSAVLKAMAKAIKTAWFADSPIVTQNAGIQLTEIPLEILPENPIGLPFKVLINKTGYDPGGTKIYYTITGVPPLYPVAGGRKILGAIEYANTNGVQPSLTKDYTIIAQATLPGREQWFTSYASRSYRRVVQVATNLIGLNFSAGDLNGTIYGSIFMQAGGLANLNAGSKIYGNLYVPSLPAVSLPNVSPNPVVGNGQYFPYTLSLTNSTSVVYTNTNTTVTINRSLIGGKEYSASGVEVSASATTDWRQVVDLSGIVSTNYNLTMNPSAYIDGKLFRNGDPPPLPDRPTFQPSFPTIGITSTITGITNLQGILQTNSALDLAILPTNAVFYALTMDSTNAIVRLGSTNTNPTITNRYFFDAGSWKKGQIQILGPVEIFFKGSFANDGVTIGNSNTIRQTVIYATNGDVTVGVASGSAAPANVYALVDARSNNVTVDKSGVFTGSILAYSVNVKAGGQVYVSSGSR
jgi:prepilin-type N-terminal cleavage/methylation domain-containing protein